MKTIITENIQSMIKTLKLGYWNDESEEFIHIDDDNIKEVAEYLECSEGLLRLLTTMFGLVAADAHTDLADIWKRLDDIVARF